VTQAGSTSTDEVSIGINGLDLRLPTALAADEIVGKLRDGTYEEDEARAVDRCIRQGSRVLELGAGIGYVSSLAARAAGAANVLSVEANPDLIPVIEGNLARNGQAEATVLHAAVAADVLEGSTAEFHLADFYTASSLSGGSGRKVTVPLVSVTDLIAAHRPHVILMDVEGAEEHLFDKRWKCPLRFFVLELHPKKYGAEVIKKIVDFMSAMDMTYDPVVSTRKILGFRRVWSTDQKDT